MACVTPLHALAGMLRRPPPPEGMATRVIAVDGCGGAGKSTLAARLARELGGAPVVHTDDFASWDDPLEWWPRLLRDFLEPLRVGVAVRFQRYDWDAHMLGDWVELPPEPEVIILEGVSASREAFRPFLSATVWVESPAAERLRRGIERDGPEFQHDWEQWMAAEDAYVARESPHLRADLVVDGASSIPHDPSRQVVVVRGPG